MANTKDNRWAQLPASDTAQRLVRTLFQSLFERVDNLDTRGTGNVPADGSVTADKLAAGAVVAAKIASGAVGFGKLANDVKAYLPGNPAIIVGAEAANTINVTAQLKDAAGNNVSGARVCRVWLSATPGGAVVGTAPDGAVAIGTDGIVIASLTAKTHLIVATSATGAFDLNLTESTAKTFYLNLESDGRLYSSGAITFA